MATRRGLRLSARTPRSVGDVLEAGDLVITLCDHARKDLGAVSEIHWSLPNPSADGILSAFEATYQDLTNRICRLRPLLAAA